MVFILWLDDRFLRKFSLRVLRRAEQGLPTLRLSERDMLREGLVLALVMFRREKAPLAKRLRRLIAPDDFVEGTPMPQLLCKLPLMLTVGSVEIELMASSEISEMVFRDGYFLMAFDLKLLLAVAGHTVVGSSFSSYLVNNGDIDCGDFRRGLYLYL